MVHRPPVQPATALANEQILPQLPQLTASVIRLRSQPLPGAPSQSPKPRLHEATTHTRLPHPGTALGGAHTLPQAPQFCTVARFTSQPSPAMLLQSANPKLQARAHLPKLHTGLALAPPGHTLPQAPQLNRSLDEATSQPSAGTLLQSRKPR